MSFDWADYLTIADELVAMSSRVPAVDACHRAAISRAYYAAFNKAREVALNSGLLKTCPQDATAHQLVSKAYREAGAKDQRIIAADLEMLRDSRNRADYRDGWPNASKQSYAELKKARRILADLKNLPSGQL